MLDWTQFLWELCSKLPLAPRMSQNTYQESVIFDALERLLAPCMRVGEYTPARNFRSAQSASPGEREISFSTKQTHFGAVPSPEGRLRRPRAVFSPTP